MAFFLRFAGFLALFVVLVFLAVFLAVFLLVVFLAVFLLVVFLAVFLVFLFSRSLRCHMDSIHDMWFI